MKKITLALLLSVALPALADEAVAAPVDELAKASHTQTASIPKAEPTFASWLSTPAWVTRWFSKPVADTADLQKDALLAALLEQQCKGRQAEQQTVLAQQVAISLEVVASEILEHALALSGLDDTSAVFSSNLQKALAAHLDAVAPQDHAALLAALDKVALDIFHVTHGKEDQRTICTGALRVHNLIADHGTAIIPQEGNMVSRFVADRPGTSAALVGVAVTTGWLVARSAKNTAVAAAKITTKAATRAALEAAKAAAIGAAQEGLQENAAKTAAETAVNAAWATILAAIPA